MNGRSGPHGEAGGDDRINWKVKLNGATTKITKDVKIGDCQHSRAGDHDSGPTAIEPVSRKPDNQAGATHRSNANNRK